MKTSERQELIEKLVDHILNIASTDFFADALLFGRVGFTEMSDSELEDAADLWGV